MSTFRVGPRSKIIFFVVTGVVLLEAIANGFIYYSNRQLLLTAIEKEHTVITSELNQTIVELSQATATSSPHYLFLSAPIQKIAQKLVSSDKGLLAIISYPTSGNVLESGTLIEGPNSYFHTANARDIRSIFYALRTGRSVYYIDHKSPAPVLKTFVPGQFPAGTPYVDEFISDYGKEVQSVIQRQLQSMVLASLCTLLVTIAYGYALGWYVAAHVLRLQTQITTLTVNTSAFRGKLGRSDELGGIITHVNKLPAPMSLDFNRVIHYERSSTMRYIGLISQSLIHELRSPAMAILHILHALRKTQTFTPQANEALTHMTTAVEHLNNVIDSFSHMIHEGYRLEMENYDLSEIVKEAVDMFSPIAHKYGTTITTNFRSESYVARVDKLKLRMVIINVLKNSLEAMEHVKSNKRIEVNFSRDLHNHLRIDVVDHGSGIPKETWTEIFTPFKTTKKDGFGLGLSLSAMLILGMGGDIFVKESSTSGSTIRIVIPSAELNVT